jgi:CO/xanthine dehydrogenase FAD-binding subunit
MSLARFDYYAPESIEDACRLLMEQGGGAVVMAGGTDILLKIRRGFLKAKAIIDLQKIKGMNRILFEEGKGLTISAMARLADVGLHPIIKDKYPAVADAAKATANVQIRNMGTVAGNLCNAAPSADNAPVLIAMGAKVTLAGVKGKRQLPLDEFFKGPGLTAIGQGEILTSIHVPMPRVGSGASYKHISPRGKVDISAVGVGVMLTMNGDICEEAKIALGAVAPIPMRAIKAEKIIKGGRISAGLLEKAGLEASQECAPITDVRATAEYRKKMVAVLTIRAIDEASSRASGK